MKAIKAYRVRYALGLKMFLGTIEALFLVQPEVGDVINAFNTDGSLGLPENAHHLTRIRDGKYSIDEVVVWAKDDSQ